MTRQRLQHLTFAAPRAMPDGTVVLGATVNTFADDAVESDGSRWVELAYAVSMAGSDVTLSREDFERVVENFKRYPCAPVVIEHADTDWFPANPKWAEPHGHVEELALGEREITEMDGTTRMAATLRGRVSFDADTASEVGAKKKWRFGSITMLKGVKDEATGAALGALLWSWSLTAHPRLTGLNPIPASIRAHPELERLLRADQTAPRGEPAPTHQENSPMKFALLLASLGMAAAATEDEAEKRVTAAAQLGLDALKAVGLPPTATPAEFAAKVAELGAAAAQAPKLHAELEVFRAEKAAADKALRASWINDLVEAQPHLTSVKGSLELHAERDWAGFSAAYPRPTRDALVTAAAERAQREQDAGRSTPVTLAAPASGNPSTRDAPRTTPAAQDLATGIRTVLAEFGRDSSAISVAEAISLGHTPQTLRDALSVGA